MSTITCRTCKKEKPLSDFPFQKKYGYRGDAPGCYRKDCKQCTAEYAREYRKTYVKKNSYRVDVDRYIYSACSVKVGDAKARATKAGIPCTITTDYMYDLLLASGMRCALSGLPLSCEKRAPHVMSIDQILPGKGYTEGNVQWVSWSVNRAKGDLTHADFLKMCRAVVRCNDYPEMEYTQAGGSALPSNEG